MPSNRFDFQELGEEPVAAADIVAPAIETVQTGGTQSGSSSSKRKTPPRLSEVRVDDPRGYESFLNKDNDPVSNPWLQMGAVRSLKPAEYIGGRGEKAGEFSYPAGVAVDGAGVLFVADTFNNRIQRFTPDGAVSIIGTCGTGHAQFQAPMGIAVDDRRAFYIVEQGNHRVQKFTAEGVLVLVFGELGIMPGQLRQPMGITVSPVTGEIIVADSGNNRVQRFAQDGRFVGAVGDRQGGGRGLAAPSAVCCDLRGNIFVADTKGNRIRRYDVSGRALGEYGKGSDNPISMAASALDIEEPHALACSPDGDLVIADGREPSGRLTIIEADSGALHSSMTRCGRQLGALAKPSGVAIAPPNANPRGDVYVADTLNHRVLRFIWQ